MTWSFFASGHGKGAVDGIGATIKRSLWKAIMARQVTINTPKEAFSFFVQNKNLSGVTVLYGDKNEINKKTLFLQKRWENLKSVKNIQKMHYFESSGFNSLLFGVTVASNLNKGCLKRFSYSDIYTSTESE